MSTHRNTSQQGMTFIEAGSFLMGHQDADSRWPAHTVDLDAYWIDRYPVTNADYEVFVKETGHEQPTHWISEAYQPDMANHPTVYIPFDDAKAYAKWIGKRLPSEAEWEKAARGTEGQSYPWGNSEAAERCNTNGDYGGTTPVDKFAAGASPYGVMDMSGNVLEWVADWHGDYDTSEPNRNPVGPPTGKHRCTRGGHYDVLARDARCASRHWNPPEKGQHHIGFRCAKNASLGDS